MAAEHPEHFVNYVARIISGDRKSYYIQGVGGLGKTRVLHQLRACLDKDEEEYDSFLIEGKRSVFFWGAGPGSHNNPFEDIYALHDRLFSSQGSDSKKKVMLLFDDVDLLIKSVISFYKGNDSVEGQTERETIIIKLAQIFDHFGKTVLNPTGDLAYVMGTLARDEILELYRSLEVSELREALMVISGALRYFEVHVLDPYASGWDWKQLFSKKESQEMVLLLERLTGGHPALVYGAEKELYLLDEEKRKDVASVEAHLEVMLLEKHFDPIRKAYRHLRHSAEQEGVRAYQRALAALKTMARRRQERIDNALARVILRRVALAKPVAGDLKTYTIAGNLIRQMILEDIEVLENILVIPDPQEPDRRGTLKFLGRQSAEFSLMKAEWCIVHKLDRHRLRPVSEQELREAAGQWLDSDRGVVMTIQRLRTKLKEAGYIEVLVNVRGRGYMLAEEPTLAQSEE